MANSTTPYRLPDGRMAVDVTENKTLAIKDQGYVQNVVADALNITLPATVVGYNYTIRNGGDAPTGAPVGAGSNESAIVKITPSASDLIAGIELTASDDDSINNTKATARVGDEISLVGNGTTGWNVVAPVKGIWAQIAL